MHDQHDDLCSSGKVLLYGSTCTLTQLSATAGKPCRAEQKYL